MSVGGRFLSGSCLCGAVRFEIDGDFERFYLCHCRHCQKDTGSAHAANLFSSSARLIWQQGEQQVTTFQLPATRHSKSFCGRCGSALPGYQMEGRLLVVPAGSLDQAIDITVDAHVFTDSRAHWDYALETIAEFSGAPTS